MSRTIGGGSGEFGPITRYFVDYDGDGCPNQSQSPAYTEFRDSGFLFDGDTIALDTGVVQYVELRNADPASGFPVVTGSNVGSFTISQTGVYSTNDDGGCPIVLTEWTVRRSAGTPSGFYDDIVIVMEDEWGQVWESDPYTFTVP